MIWVNILLAIILVMITIGIHTLTTKFIIQRVQHMRTKKSLVELTNKYYWIASMVLILLTASILESVLWAVTYMAVGAIDVFEQALYFSIVTFTTLGYGDVTLNESWRLFAAFEAATGIIVFGWSTAIVMTLVQKILLKRS